MHHLLEEKDRADTEKKKVGREIERFFENCFTGLSFCDIVFREAARKKKQ
jgi:hypothetical protein